jgi:hypothetical protein
VWALGVVGIIGPALAGGTSLLGRLAVTSVHRSSLVFVGGSRHRRHTVGSGCLTST